MARVAIEKYIVFNPVVRLCGVGRFFNSKNFEGMEIMRDSLSLFECRLLVKSDYG